MTVTTAPAPMDPRPSSNRMPRLATEPPVDDRVLVWDGPSGRYHSVDLNNPSDGRWAAATAIAAVEGRGRDSRRRAPQRRRLHRALEKARRWLPTIARESDAMDELAAGYLEMARRYEDRGDDISARMAATCAAAIRQSAAAADRRRQR